MAENLKIPASVDLEIRQAEAKAKVLADKVNASFQKIKIGGFDSSGLKAGSAALGRIRQDADQFTKSMEAANARVLAFGTAVGVIEGMRRSFLALVKTTVDVEKALTQISVVAGDNFTKAGISIEQFGKQIFQTAKLTGQSFETTSKAALEFSRQGLGVQESLKRTRDALILSRISGVEYKTAVDGLTSTLNAFRQSGIDSTTVINKLVAVDNAAAVSLIDLIKGLQRSASVAQLTGQNIDQTIASIATLQEITARGGSQIGNSLKSIFTRLYDEDSIKFLETFQGGVIKVRDEVGNLIPAIEIMRNLGNAIKDLPKEQQLNIFKDISGLYQVNAAAALAGQGLQELNKQKAIYDKNLATSQGAKDNALSANATLAEILSSKFNTLGVQLEEILNSAGKIGVTNPLSSLLDSVSEAGDFIQNILEGTDKFSQTIQGIGRFLGGSLFSPAVFGAIAIAIGKIGVNFATFAVNAGKTFLGLNKASQEQAAIQRSIAAYIQQSGANLSSLLTSESARLNLAKQISAEWAKQAVYSKQVSSVAQVVAGSVYGSGLRVGESGPTLAKKGLRSAEGYLPDLVSGEMNDIRKGVGGASSNSKVVVMPNFPLGGGNKGLMVANSSESVVNLGGGKFGVLNPDMMGKRAASGFSAPKATIQNKKGQFIGGTELRSAESAIQSLIELLVGTGASAANILSALRNFIGAMDLQAKSVKLLIDLGEQHAQSMKDEAIAAQNAATAQMKMAQAQDAFIKSGGPNLAIMNKGGTGFSSSPELSGLGFRRPAKEGPLQGDPFGISNVYTPEKLEQMRKGKVFNERKQIDINNRRSEQAYQKRLQDTIFAQRSSISSRDIAIGETKFKLKTEKDSVQKKKLIAQLRFEQSFREFNARMLGANEKTLFERYGTDTSKFGGKPLSQNQRVNNDALKESLRKRLEGRFSANGALNSQKGGFSDFSKNGPLSPDGGLAPAMEKTKKSFIEVAGKLILLQAATDGIASAFGGTESSVGKFSQLLSQASLGLLAIGELSKINTSEFADTLKSSIEKAGEKIKNIGTSGTSDFARGARAGVAGEGSAADFAEFGDSKRKGVLSSSRSARIGRRLGGATAGVSKFISGAAGAASTAIGFLPIIGQVALGATILYQGLKIFKPDLFENLKVGLGGLTKEAEKSAQAFKDNAEFLFDATGKAVLRGSKDVQQNFQSRVEESRRNRIARSSGIDTEGKNQQQISNELLGKRIDSLLSNTKTGDKKTITKSGGQDSLLGKDVEIDETLGNIDASITTVIKENLQLLSNQTEDGLREFLSSKGVSKINGKDIKDAGFDKLQDEVYKLFINNILNEIGTIKLTKETGGSKDFIDLLAANFYKLPEKTPQKTKPQTGGVNLFQRFISPFYKATNGDPESIQKFLEVQKEIELLAFDASAANIEAKIKNLESLSTSSNLSGKEKNDIENSIARFQKAVLKNSLEKLEAESKASISQIETDVVNKKISPLQGDAEIAKINKQLSVQETEIEANIKSITDNTKIRQREFDAIQKLVPTINAAAAALSSLNVLEAGFDAQINSLESKANNPALNIYQQEDIQRQINRVRAESLKKVGQEQALATFASASAQAQKLPDDERAAALNEASDAYLAQTIAINSQIEALNEANKQIGFLASSSQEFGNLLIDFQRNVGRDRAQNQFNLLQATDKSSIVGGLISEQSFDAVQGKSGKDLVSSLSEQNAIRQQQFDIATAASRVERLNLETELELNQQIFTIRNSDLSSSEKQLAIESAINANLEKRRSFGFGIRESLSGMQDEVNSFGATFGQTATEGFRDGLVSAMQVAVSQTGNLKEALLDVALAFANKLRDAALTNLANVLVSGSKGGGGGSGWAGIISGVFDYFGGGVQKKAAGGQVTGGSGVKDDVPTLLMGGEYVVNKKAVSTYGKSFFEALNNRSVGKMAQGGYFAPGVRGQGNISGKDNLLDFATQTATFGGQDVRRSLRGGAGMVSLEPESLRLSNFNRFGDSPIVQATQDAKDQAFGLYTDQLGQEKQYKEELADYYRQLEEARAAQKKAEKDKKKQFLISLATAVVSAGISYGMSGAKSGGKTGGKGGETKFTGGKIRGVSERPFSAAKSGLSSNSYSGGSSFSSSSSLPNMPQFDWREMIRQINATVANKSFTNYDLGINRGGSYGSSLLLPSTSYTPYGRNSGGAISGSGDTVPVMASKGEFMLNSSAAKKIGLSNLYAMNNGASPSGESDSSAVVARLDELIEKTMGASNVTVNVTVSKDGEQSSQEGGGDQGNKMLAEKLRGAVIQVIQSEQRPGGILSKR